MNFQRIQSIDSQPFNLDEFYADYYGVMSTISANRIFENILFYRYMEKFLEEYQIDLIKIYPLDMDIADLVFNLAEEDKMAEYWCGLNYENENFFISTATSCGFEMLMFPSDATLWEEDLTISSVEENIAYIMKKVHQDMPEWGNIVEECKDVIEYSYSYMEDGSIYIMPHAIRVGLYARIYCRMSDFLFDNIRKTHHFLLLLPCIIKSFHHYRLFL